MMQKICLLPDATGRDRQPARELVAKFFTYGTPRGGIAFEIGALDWAEEAFGTDPKDYGLSRVVVGPKSDGEGCPSS